MDNKFFKFLSDFIELTKKNKENTFYSCLIFFCIVSFIFKKYIATSLILSYYIQKNMKKHEKFIKSKILASIFLILVFFVFIYILIFRGNVLLSFFSFMFIILLFFCYTVCFLACYYENQYQAKKALKEAIKLIIFRNDRKYSEFLNEFINSLFLNLTIVIFLIYLVSLLKNYIPDIDKVISESCLMPYLTVLIVKIIDFLKEKVLEIE